ncbi:zinc finger protein, partial [Aphelenchoides avenae]
LPTCDSCGLELPDVNAFQLHSEACLPRRQGGYVVCQKSGCGYRTKQVPNLRNHVIAMHTKSKLYECSLCDFKTTWQTSLCGHNRKVHGQQTPNNRKRRSPTEPEAIGDTPKRPCLGALTSRSPVRSVECSPESVLSTDVEPDLACDGTVMQHSE